MAVGSDVEPSTRWLLIFSIIFKLYSLCYLENISFQVIAAQLSHISCAYYTHSRSKVMTMICSFNSQLRTPSTLSIMYLHDREQLFSSCLLPVLKVWSSVKPFVWKWVLFASERQLIFMWKVSLHLTSHWNRGIRQLGNGQFPDMYLSIPSMSNTHHLFKLWIQNSSGATRTSHRSREIRVTICTIRTSGECDTFRWNKMK